MFGSCSQPIKANKIISCGTRDFQHSVRTEATKRRQLMTRQSPLVSVAIRTACELRNSRSSIFNQNSSNKEMTTCDLHSRPSSMRTADLLFKANGTRDFQHSIRTAATAKETTTTRQSPLVSTLHANCLRTANLLFVEVTHLDHQMNQNQKKLMHAM